MKKLILLTILAFFLGGALQLNAQKQSGEYLGLPGDNFNLYAAMNLFQESETLESFERNLNDPEVMVNNLDLNGDKLVDYIMVMDYPDDNVHNIVLRVALNKNEFQDVAVFTVQKFRDGSVQIQLIGDEALYGPNYIIEPNYDETPNPGYTTRSNIKKSKRNNVTVVTTTYYEVASWPLIVYINRPTYVVWRSSWGWGYYPEYWHPWTPHYYHYYYGYHYSWNNHYYSHYRPWKHYRCDRYRTVYYTNIRHQSPTVVVNVNRGNYKNTYSRPEKRRDGEVLYSQRISSGTTSPTRVRSTGNVNDRQSPRANTEVSTRAARPETGVRSNGQSDNTRNDRAVRPTTETRSQNPQKANRAAEVKERSAQSREDVVRPVRSVDKTSREKAPSSKERSVKTDRSSAQPARSNEIVRPERERSAPPTQKVERPSSNTRSQPARSNESVSRREKSASPSMERSQPARASNQKAPAARSSEVSGRANTKESAKKESSKTQDSGRSRSERR
jgi:hypothetical protein